MRPAVHASILRNRAGRPRPVMRPHTFSLRRLLLVIAVGALLFLPGLVISIVGLQKTEAEMNALIPGKRILFQAIGPALTTLGVVCLFFACIYYSCYGAGESNRLPGGSHQSSVNSDHRHHHHGHQGYNSSYLNTPEGGVRRLSLKDELYLARTSPRPSPHPSPHSGPRHAKEERIPLASSDFTSREKGQSPPPTIHIDQAPETETENEAQDTEQLVNGDVQSNGPSAV